MKEGIRSFADVRKFLCESLDSESLRAFFQFYKINHISVDIGHISIDIGKKLNIGVFKNFL